MVPFRLSFSPGYGVDGIFLFFLFGDIFADLLVLCDMLLRRLLFHTSFNPRLSSIVMPEVALTEACVNEQKRENRLTYQEKRRRRVSRRILLVTDFVCVFPVDYIAFACGMADPTPLRIIKMLRMIRVMEQVNIIFLMLERRRLIVNAGLRRMIVLWSVFFFFGHWFSCGFYALGRYTTTGDSWAVTDGLIAYDEDTGAYGPAAGTTTARAYIRTIYWAMITMVTVGLGDVVPAKASGPETTFTLMTMYMGMTLTCMVIGNLTNMVTNLDASEDEFHTKMDNMNKYMSYRHLSTDLRDRIRAYYTYMWTSLKGINEAQFLRDLPITLRLQVAGLRSKDLVTQVTFLRKLRDPVINAICVALEQVIISPGDFVAKESQNMPGCYWLRRGEAEVVSAQGTILQQLSAKQGSYVGESSLFFPGTFDNSIRAKSYCEFFFLKKELFEDILSESLDEEEFEEVRAAAEKALKASAKAKKFFGLDANDKPKSSWRDILEPKSRFREVWNLIQSVSAIYMGMMVPYRMVTQTFMYRELVDPADYALDWIFDILFIIDIIFRSQMFGFVREGIVIRDKFRIFENYRESESIFLDVLVSFPIDLIAIKHTSFLPYLRLTKLFRMSYIMAYYDLATSYMAARRITISNAMHRIIKIFFWVIWCVHIVGCGWMLMSLISRNNAISPLSLAVYNEFVGNGTKLDCELHTNTDWVCKDGETWPKIDHTKPGVTYLRAIYFVLVDMTTEGYGDLIPYNTLETAYVAFITFIGGLGYPAVVGAMAALISSLDTARAEFQNKLAVLTQYMAVKHFPRPLKVRIMRYYDYLWSRQRGVDEDYILHDLPASLRMEVQEYINGAIMRNITFLDGIDQELLRHLLSVLQPSVFLPGDNIITAGELGQDMFLLETGATRVTSPDGKLTYAILTPGDYFGEGSLLGLEKRTANIVAIGYCDCFVLNKDDFDRVTKEFPLQRELVIARLRSTLQDKRAKNLAVVENMQNHSKLGVITSYEYEERKTVSDTSWRHPESLLRRFWDLLILLVLGFNFAAVPTRLALNAGLELFAIDYCLDAILVADTFLRYRHFGFVHEGQVYAETDEVVANYRKSGVFLRDILIIMPYDVFVLIPYIYWTFQSADHTLTDENVSSLALVMACCRIPKLLLLLRMNRLKSNMDTLFGMSSFREYTATYRLIRLMVAVVCIAHWTGCFFYAIAYYQQPDDVAYDACLLEMEELYPNNTDRIIQYDPDMCPNLTFFSIEGRNSSELTSTLTCGATFEAHCRWNNTWINNQMARGLLPLDGGRLDHQYLRALNWALPTLVVVVIGDTIPVDIPGTLYVTIMIIIGVTINAAIIGSIANLVANLEGSAAKYRDKMDTFERFLYMYQIPPSLQQRTRNYLEYLWETEKDAVQASLVENMPATLRAEVSNFLKLRFVIQTPFFEFCDPALAKGIASKLRTEVYSPMDFIIYEGDVGEDMYFIEQGTVQMVSFRGKWRSGHRASSVVEPVSPTNATATRVLSFTRIPMESPSNANIKGKMYSAQVTPAQSQSTNILKSNSLSSQQLSGKGVNGSIPSLPTTPRKQPSLSSLRSSANASQRASMVALDGNVSDDDIIILATLEAGSYFGETAVFFNERRSCSARALDFTEVYTLSREDLDEILLRYPHQSDRMFDVVSSIRENNQLRNDNLRSNMESIIAGSRMLNFMSEKRQSFTGGSILDYGRRMLTKRPSFLRNASTATNIVQRGSANFGSTFYRAFVGGNSGRATPNANANKKYGVDGKVVPKLAHHLLADSKSQKKRAAAAALLQRHIHKPNDTFCRVWNMASLFFVLYFAVSIPFRYAFFADGLPPLQDHRISVGIWVWFCFEYCIDFFFIIDIYLRYRKFAFNRYGKVITSQVEIANNYRQTWLVYDVIASLPLDLIPLGHVIAHPSMSHITALSAARFVHLVRFMRINGYSRLLDKYIHEMFPRINSSVIGVLFLFVGILLLNHWASCTWFMMHRYLEHDKHKTWAIADNLATYDPEQGIHNIFNDDLTPWFCYLRALYFTVSTMSSVGYGDVRPYSLIETLHELTVVVLGACTFAALIGSVAVVFLHWDSRGDIAFKSRLRKLLDFMAFRELPGGLQEEIIDHFTNHWEHFEGVNMHEVIQDLPLPLQLELAICIHRNIISKVRGLRKCHIHVQRHIARKLQTQICSEGEHVFRAGEIGHEIYFILSGEVEVTRQSDGRSMSSRNLLSLATPATMSLNTGKNYTLREGQHFGGECLYSLSGERTQTVRCLKDCELVYILKDEFERIMIEFPEHRNIGIFAELVSSEQKTVKQTKDLQRQVAEIAGSVQTPLGRFSARHIANILGNPNTDFLRDGQKRKLMMHKKTLIHQQLGDDTIVSHAQSRQSVKRFSCVLEHPISTKPRPDSERKPGIRSTSLTIAEDAKVEDDHVHESEADDELGAMESAGNDWADPVAARQLSDEQKKSTRRLTRQLSEKSDKLATMIKTNQKTDRRATAFRGARKTKVPPVRTRQSLTFEDVQDLLIYTKPAPGDEIFSPLDDLPVLSPNHLERRHDELH